MLVLDCRARPATPSHVLNSEAVRAAAIGALRDIYGFDTDLSDDGAIALVRIRQNLEVTMGLEPIVAVGPLLSIIDMCSDAVGDAYPVDYEQKALARLERRP